ncbi:MAG TPA: hypothetical protein GX715_17160 [Armatimonadetes bacterium]|jgi:hypothetical protein|nr:hypothetical protein [Armatimonadota bacterium]
MYTYLRIEELIQEGHELRCTATAFEEREVPDNTRIRYASWREEARRRIARRAEPASGWDALPATGREMARGAEETLAILQQMTGA